MYARIILRDTPILVKLTAYEKIRTQYKRLPAYDAKHCDIMLDTPNKIFMMAAKSIFEDVDVSSLDVWQECVKFVINYSEHDTRLARLCGQAYMDMLAICPQEVHGIFTVVNLFTAVQWWSVKRLWSTDENFRRVVSSTFDHTAHNRSTVCITQACNGILDGRTGVHPELLKVKYNHDVSDKW